MGLLGIATLVLAACAALILIVYLVKRPRLTGATKVWLLLGIEGKRAGWRVLRRQAHVDQRLDPAQLDDLIARAEQQVETVEGLRIEAAAEVFG
jgi:hypothetical protein